MMSEAITDQHSSVATDEQLKARDKDVWWYDADIATVPPKARELLENYSGIPSDQVKSHIFEVRERAWQVFPYPCIGGWRFLSLNLCTTPQYSEILERLQRGEKLLDIGCCFGQELRRLVYDGAPAANLFGFDLRSEFFALGDELFKDEDKFHAATMIADDAFRRPMPPRLQSEVQGKVSIVYAGSFFHLFDRPEQAYLAKLVANLLRPEPGSMVLGRQVGSHEPSRNVHRTNGGGHMFRHNVASWTEMWKEVGQELGIEWDVEAELVEHELIVEAKPDRPLVPQLRFCVKRK